MKTPFEFHISLRIHHPDWDLQPVSKKLNLSAKRIWKVGESRRTPKGRELGGVYDQSYCVVDIGSGTDGEIVECISGFLDRIQSHKNLLNEIRQTGGSLDFFVFWHPNGDTGEVFKSDLLARMVELGIDLGINVYDDRHAH